MKYEIIEKVVHDTSGLFSTGDVTNRPCPAITIGVNSVNSCHYQIHYRLSDTPPTEAPMTDPKKPPYRVMTMDEIRALPWNGRNVVSTFSGCGGSSTGYRMGGYKVRWASEFIPAAQESYAANKAPYTILDTRDIRKVQPGDILRATGLKEGEIDLFDGSPPCAAFSTAGKREAGWGKVKKYSDTTQRVDDLFFEFTRLIKGTQPKTFVAENVSGLVKGTAKGYFLEILDTLKKCGYRVTAKVLDAQWLGVPQSRQRLILIGVRNDLKGNPQHPGPLGYNYTVRDALPWVRSVQGRTGPGFTQTESEVDQPMNAILVQDPAQTRYVVEADSDISRYAIGAEWDKLKPGEPCQAITQRGGDNTVASVTHPTEKRKFSIAELRRICGFPDDFILTGTYQQQWERLGRAVPPVMMMHIAKAVQRTLDANGVPNG